MKIKVKKIVSFFNSLYPFRKAEKWDKVGHTFGNIDQPVTNIIVALDLTREVFDKAIETHSQMIITHHPFIFNDDLEVEMSEAPYKQELLERVKNTGISLLALHTNYDINANGTSKQVLKTMGMASKSINHKSKYGCLVAKPIRIQDLEEIIAKKLNLPILQMSIIEDMIYNKWGILAGSGSPADIIALSKSGAEFVVTSDIKWSTWIMAKELNIPLIQIPHFVENVFTNDVYTIIKKNFSKIDVHKIDVMKFEI